MGSKGLLLFCLLVTVLQVRAQIGCYPNSLCGNDGSVTSDVATVEDCCSSDLTVTRSYVPSGSSTCQPCIVIGFIPSSVKVQENVQATQDIDVGLLTTASDAINVATLDIVVAVNPALSTATIGSDYLFHGATNLTHTYSTQISFLPIAVEYEILTDLLPGEVESFELTITSATSEQGFEILVNNSVTVDIVDDDVLEVQFLDTEFSATESAGQKEILFIITNPIIIDTHFIVRPMTYQEYDDQYNTLKADHPDLTPFTLGDEYDQAEGEDFIQGDISFTILANKTGPNQPVKISLIDDDLLEPPEEGLRLLLMVDESKGTPQSAVSFGRRLALFRIDDRDDNITFGFVNAEHHLDDVNGTYEIQLLLSITHGRTEIPLVLSFTFEESDADVGIDFLDFSTSVIEIQPPDTFVLQNNLVVTVLGDDLFEGNETIVVDIIRPKLLLPAPFIVNTILPPESIVKPPSDDNIIVSLQRTEILIREVLENFSVTFTVPQTVNEGETFYPELYVSHEVNATFVVHLSSGTATVEDYASFFERVEFGPSLYSNMTNSPVMIKHDDLVEPSETFSVNILLTNPRSLQDLVTYNKSHQLITIIDQNTAIIGFRQEIIEVSEDAGVVLLTVAVLDDQLAGGAEVTVRLSTMAGTAIDADFAQVASQDLVLNANQQEHTVSIDIVDDMLYEDKEMFTANLVLLDSNVNVNVNPSEATVSINDNDHMLIGFKKTAYEVNEKVGSVSFEVEVKNNGMFDVPLDFTVTDIEGEAKRMVDYNELANVALQLQPGQTSVEYSITIINDDVMEPNFESFRISLHTNQPRVTTMPGFNEAVVSITNDDNVTIGFDNVMYQFPENASFAHQVCVSIMEKQLADNRNVDVTLKSTDETAIAPNDYEAVDQVLTFTSATTSSCVNIVIKPDDVLEGTEIFVLSLTTSDSSVNLDPEEADVIIQDHDNVSVSFKSDHYTYDESGGQAVVEVVLLGQIEVDVTVSINGGPSTQTDIGTDRVVFNDRAIFVPGGPTEISLSAQIVNDVVALEDNETVHVILTIDSPMFDVTLGTFPTTTVTIVDNDVVELSFTESEFNVNEDVGKFPVCVQKQLQTIKDLAVDVYSLDGTATAHLDYVLTDTMVVIAKNSLQGCLDVEIIDDDVFEGEETFSLELADPMEDNVLLISPYTVDVTIIGQDVLVCTLNTNLVLNTFSEQIQTGLNFSISEGCEHKLVTSCDDMLDLEIRVDFFKDNFTSTKVAIIYEEETVIINEDLSIEPANLLPDSGIEYKKNTNFVSVSIPEIMLTVTRNLTELSVTTSNGSLPLAGLCGGLDGKMYFRNCSEGVAEGRNMRKFKNNYRLKPDDQILREERQECGITANDTVIGDPLMTVPINVPKHEPDHLCYEIHGAKDKYFNFISDECTSVNAHYVQASVDEKMNIIDSISIVAIDKQHTCHNISVSVLGCSATVDGNTLQHVSGKQSSVNSTYDKNGIFVRSYKSRTRISVPNCADNSLVMWVFCQHQPFQDPFNDSYTEPVDMIKFEITRGRNLKEYSHGLLGQFWNIPIKVEPFTGVPRATADPEFVYYTVNVTHPRSESRVFIGVWFDMTWEFESKECLYVGNKQGGPVGEVEEPNDSVIEGVYMDYTTADAFETDFEYAVFKKDACSSP